LSLPLLHEARGFAASGYTLDIFVTAVRHGFALLRFHNLVHEKLIRFYEGFKSDAHPMAIMVRLRIGGYIGYMAIMVRLRIAARCDTTGASYHQLTDSSSIILQVGVVGALSAFYDAKDWRNKDHAWMSCVRLIAKMPTIAAMAYKTSIGQVIKVARV
jgi:citrate synthase